MALVRFLRHAPPYMPGDVAPYDDATAGTLVARGLAVPVKEPAPAKPAEPVAAKLAKT